MIGNFSKLASTPPVGTLPSAMRKTDDGTTCRTNLLHLLCYYLFPEDDMII
jgi:hypothetical protein